MNASGVDVLIVTALPDELDALLAVSPDVWIEEGVEPPYHVAIFEAYAGPIKVVAARPLKMGPTAAATLAAKLTERLKPRCLAMCGVCAGHPDETDLGDVVIADRVFQHDEGKKKPHGFEGDLWVRSVHNKWLRVAQELQGSASGLPGYQEPSPEDSQWWFLDKLLPAEDPITRHGFFRDPLKSPALRRYIPDNKRHETLRHLSDDLKYVVRKGRQFELTAEGRDAVEEQMVFHGTLVQACPYHIHVGPIASGNAVEADGTIWKKLAENGMRKALAVEMEAAAIGEVAADNDIPFFITKAVMDHADPKKGERFKQFAARVSAHVLHNFLNQVIEPHALLQTNARWEVTFELEYDNFTEGDLLRLESAMQELSGDHKLKITNLRPGSLVAGVESTLAAHLAIRARFENGEHIIGYKITDIRRARIVSLLNDFEKLRRSVLGLYSSSGVHYGTAFLLKPQLLATSLSSVAELEGESINPRTTLILKYHARTGDLALHTISQPNIVAYNVFSNWAIIAVPLIENLISEPLTPTADYSGGSSWHAFCFVSDKRPRALRGTLDATQQKPLIKLNMREMESGDSLVGVSGAPVTDEHGHVIGMICASEPSQNALYAYPIESLITSINSHTQNEPGIRQTLSSVPPNQPDQEPPVLGTARPMRFRTGVDLPENIARAYLHSEYERVLGMIDDELAREHTKRQIAALWATKGEAYVALQHSQAASSCFQEAAFQFEKNAPDYWVYKIRASVVAGWSDQARSDAGTALERFPGNHDIWIAHVWACAPSPGFAQYYESLSQERRTFEVIEMLIQTAHAHADWTAIVNIVNDLAVSGEIPDSISLKYSLARARMERLPVLHRDELTPPSLRDEVASIARELALIRERTRPTDKDAGLDEDIHLESSLYLVDCYQMLADSDAADELLVEIQSDFPGHYATVRTQYLALAAQGKFERAIQKIERTLDVIDERNYSAVIRDLIGVKISQYHETKDTKLMEECNNLAQRGQDKLGKQNHGLLSEALLQSRVIALRELGRLPEALEVIRNDHSAPQVFRTSAELMQLWTMGRHSEAHETYALRRKRLLDELPSTPEALARHLAVVVGTIEEYADALMVFSRFDSNLLTIDEIAVLTYCQFRAGRLKEFWDTSTKYQEMNGYVEQLSWNLVASLSRLDPFRTLAFFSQKNRSPHHWRLCYELLGLASTFGHSFSVSDESLQMFARTVPDAGADAFARRVYFVMGMASAINFLLVHLDAHFNSSDAKLSFLSAMTWLRSERSEEFYTQGISTGTIYRISQHGTELFYAMDEPTILSHMIIVAAEGSQANSIIREHLSGKSPAADECSVTSISLVEFLLHRLGQQMDVLTASSSHEIVKILPTMEELFDHVRREREEADKVERRFLELIGQEKDVHAARHCMGSIAPNVMEAMLSVWRDDTLALPAGQNPSDFAWPEDGSQILVDIMAFLNFSIFLDGRIDLLVRLPYSIGATPAFFYELARVRTAIGSIEKDRIGWRGGRPAIVPGVSYDRRLRLDTASVRTCLTQIPATVVLEGPNVKPLYDRLGIGAEVVSVAVALQTVGTPVVLWSDSLVQRKMVAERGVPSISTADLVKRCVAKSLLTPAEEIFIRVEMFGAGYQGSDLLGPDLSQLVLQILHKERGTTVLDNLFRGIKRTNIDVDAVARWCALLAIKLSAVEGPGRHVRALADHIYGFSVRVQKFDFRFLVIDELRTMHGDIEFLRFFGSMLQVKVV